MEKCFHIKNMKNLVLLIFNIQIIIHNDYTFINIIIIIIFIELNDIASFKEQIYTNKKYSFSKDNNIIEKYNFYNNDSNRKHLF